MSACVGCSCTRADRVGDGSQLLLATRVSHTLTTLRTVLRDSGAQIVERTPGLLEARTATPELILASARARLSSTEAAEVRAVVMPGMAGAGETGGAAGATGATGGDAALLVAALTAPTLAQLGARVEHADLLPLFADELGSFRSVYQPIVRLTPAGESVAPNPVIGYEALLRATGPGGPVLPAALFGAAAEAGWLHVLDRVGRTTALRGAGGWLGDDLLFVNFVPTTIYRPQVCLRTTELAAEAAGLRLDQLVFEVTESEQVTDLDHLADVFSYYRERGCRVALDDLGSGYSSLNMLVRLQPDIVKLDKDIVQRLPDPVSVAVLNAVVQITHAYGGLVLAECIETAEQADAARDLGVDLGQGWFFGRPEERGEAALRAPAAVRLPATPATLSASPSGRSTPGPASPGRDGNDSAVAVRPPEPPARAEVAGVLAVPAVLSSRGAADIEALQARALDTCSAGVTIADASVADMPLIYVNSGFEDATGYRAAEVLGRNCRFLQGPETDPTAVAALREAVRAGRDHVAVLRNYRRDGTPWWNELRLSPVRDAAGTLTHYFGFQCDVTARVEAEQRVAHLAYHDALTGLPNRVQVMARLQRELHLAATAGGRLAVLFIDLDGFKAVNDQLGHAVGDLALIAAGARLRGQLRSGDLLGRHSGDEFLAVLTGVDPDLARSIAQRAADAVLESFADPLQLQGATVQLGASVGVALYPEHGRDAAELLQAADRAMCAAKDAGRGRAVLARPRPSELR